MNPTLPKYKNPPLPPPPLNDTSTIVYGQRGYVKPLPVPDTDTIVWTETGIFDESFLKKLSWCAAIGIGVLGAIGMGYFWHSLLF